MLGLQLCILLTPLFCSAAHPARLSSHRTPRRYQDLAERQQGQCEHGAWSCTGQTLKRCVYDKIVTIQECGANDYCSATGSLVGCFWTANPGQAPPGATLIPAGIPPQPSPVPAGASGPAQPSPPVTPPPPPPPPPPPGVSTGVPNPVTSSATSYAVSPPSGSATGALNPTGTTTVSTVPGPPLSSGTGGSVAPGPNNSVTTGTFSAPHYVVYTDLSFIPEKTMFPTPEQLSGINRFVIRFWITEKDGPFDNVLVWKNLPATERKRVLDSYHAAGIALMMSYGGETERPTSSGIDPVKLANDISTFVIEYELDGVDVNYEDLAAMAAGTGEAWVISFQRTLRSKLPSPRYLISHAPLAPWFTTHPTAYPGGGYRAVHKAVGDGIDWYNVQFYNQGTLYTDCQSLMTTSGNQFEGTSIMEIGTTVPLNKIVLGKPLAPNKGPAGGYMDFAALGVCVKEGQAKQWNGGMMLWEWAPGDVTATAKALSAAKGG